MNKYPVRQLIRTSGESDAQYVSEMLGIRPPEPGERCPTCNRRRNKPRQDDSPETREMRIKLPTERMEWAEEAFDALQEVTGGDPHSYPRGTVFEALLVLGGQHREQLRSYLTGDE